jgi:4-amino-4-deoxy-L-arabinose transferase-like glycosyltransferase
VLQDAPFRLPPALVVLLWIAALPLLMAGLGTPVAQRTQEARVLETAREMLDSRDWRQWMIPRLNGDVRLQKPPLAYWLAAGSFRVFDINDFAGRLPFALAGWLTLAVVYRFARGLLDQRFALFTVAILLTSYMFYVHFRLAETDSVAGLFVAAAIYWLWKGAAETQLKQSLLAYHLAGVAIALAVLSKGPPGVFPVLFFIAWAIVERNWGALRRALLSGALLTTAILAGWWFLYVRTSPYAHVIGDELSVVTGGEDHRQAFYMYFPQMLRASAPWTGLMIFGLVCAIRDWRTQPAARAALLWLGVILLPLCIIGNRQNHYLVPLTPALAMLAAYAVESALRQFGPRDAQAVRWVMGVTIALSFLAPIGVYWFARHQNGFLQTQDLVVIVLLLAAVLAAASLGRRHGLSAAVASYAAGLSFCLAVMFGRWLPSLHRVTHRTVAADLREAFPEGGYCFYGRDPSFPLIWNLRQVVPTVDSEATLKRTLADAPQTVVIAQTKNNRPPPAIPAQLKQVKEFESGDEGMVFRIYRLSE